MTASKFLFLSHLLPLLFSQIVSNTSGKISKDILSIEDDIVKPTNDHRQYRALTLTNGMKVLLISDKKIRDASMALDVNAGYMNNPRNIPYLADLFAHTFLMAVWPEITQKSRISKYFESNDGHVTSTISADHTVFDLRSINTQFDDILKRFTNQLISPQLSITLLERGIWEYNYDADFDFQWKNWQYKTFLRSMADHNHDYYAPNLITQEPNMLKNDSINKVALLKDMVKFYDQHYSSNLMTLVIMGNKSISDMTNLVVPQFSRVSNKNLPMPVWLNHPYGPKQSGQIFHIEMDKFNDFNHALLMLFNIPDYGSSYFLSKPWSYVIFALTRKGQHSLSVVLKEKGLVTKVKANVEKVAEGFGFFKIDCRLTEKGEQNVMQVVRLIVQYINYVKSIEPQEWIHKELQTELQMTFDEMEYNRIYANELALKLHRVPVKFCLQEKYLMHDYQPQLIKKVLSHLTADNMNVYVWTKSVTGKPGKIGKYFDKNYSVEKMTQSFLKGLTSKSQSIEFTLPTQNPYLPSNLQESHVQNRSISIANISQPKIIHESAGFHRIWYLKDDFFMSPQTFIGFKLTNPIKRGSPSNCILSVLYETLMRRVLREKFEQEGKARLEVDFWNQNNAYVLWFSGRSKDMHDFVIRVFKILLESTTAVTEKKFGKYIDKYRKMLKSRYRANPTSKSRTYIKFLQSNVNWTDEEFEDSSKTLTYDRFQQFQRELFSQMFVEMFSYGNVSEQDTMKLFNDVWKVRQKNLPIKPLYLAEIEKPRHVLLPEGRQYVLRTTMAKKSRASFVRSLYQFSPPADQSPDQSLIRETASCVIREIQCANLRTGFRNSDGSSEKKQEKKLKILLNVHMDFIETGAQNFSSTPEQVDSMIENYLKLIEDTLMKMNETKFQTFYDKCSSPRFGITKRIAFHSMADVADWFFDPILSGTYTFSFNKTQKLDGAKKNVSRDDILSFYKEILSADSPKRRKFSVYVYPTNESKANGHENVIQQSSNVTYITDIKAFKSSLHSYVADDGRFVAVIPMFIESAAETDDDDND